MTLKNDKLNIIHYDCVDSTNNIAKDLATRGEKEGTVIVAKSQSAGRGRLGRQFYSGRGGLYFSIILRPRLLAENAVQITAAAAVAVAKAIERVSNKKTHIKWVNDIYIDGKKASGILCEGAINPENKGLFYAILGIGINVEAPKGGFPAEIKDIATAVFENEVSEETYEELLNFVLEEFLKQYNRLFGKEYLKEYKKRSMLIGKEVSFEQNGIQHIVRVIGIDDSARLIVEENGKTIKLSAGEVSIKLK